MSSVSYENISDFKQRLLNPIISTLTLTLYLHEVEQQMSHSIYSPQEHVGEKWR